MECLRWRETAPAPVLFLMLDGHVSQLELELEVKHARQRKRDDIDI